MSDETVLNRRKDDNVTHSNRRRDGMFAAAYILLIGLVYGVLHVGDLSEYVQGVMTLAIGNVIGWIASMYSYEFGTTRTSATKDSTISALAQQESKP